MKDRTLPDPFPTLFGILDILAAASDLSRDDFNAAYRRAHGKSTDEAYLKEIWPQWKARGLGWLGCRAHGPERDEIYAAVLAQSGSSSRHALAATRAMALQEAAGYCAADVVGETPRDLAVILLRAAHDAVAGLDLDLDWNATLAAAVREW